MPDDKLMPMALVSGEGPVIAVVEFGDVTDFLGELKIGRPDDQVVRATTISRRNAYGAVDYAVAGFLRDGRLFRLRSFLGQRMGDADEAYLASLNAWVPNFTAAAAALGIQGLRVRGGLLMTIPEGAWMAGLSNGGAQ